MRPQRQTAARYRGTVSRSDILLYTLPWSHVYQRVESGREDQQR